MESVLKIKLLLEKREEMMPLLKEYRVNAEGIEIFSSE